MSVDPAAICRALDLLIEAASEIRDELVRAELVVAKERRLAQQAEAAALFDLAADDADAAA